MPRTKTLKTTTTATNDPTESYASLNQELQSVLAELEGGELDIDQAVGLYERGLKAVEQLEVRLKSAENTVTELRARRDESLSD